MAALRVPKEGLTLAEAQRRLESIGPNSGFEPRPLPWWRMVADQLRSVVALVLGDALDAAAIAAVLLINTALGLVTEFRAARAMEALLRLEAPSARVLRGGTKHTIPARDLVPGDLLLLEAGDAVAADGRLIDVTGLKVDEASLTGESASVDKEPERILDPHTPLPDRVDMVYRGTTVTAGNGRAVVTATGRATQVGRVGRLIEQAQREQAPLERRLDTLGRRLVWLTLAVAALVTVIGLVQGAPLGQMLLAGVALGVAAVPEGLPVVATATLAVGMRRMAARNAVVRRLPAVEALGAATVVCTDKTGTLTAGKMTVTALWTPAREYEVAERVQEVEEPFRSGGHVADPAADAAARLALQIGVLANRADVTRGPDGPVLRGDPTEAALLVAALRAGLDPERLRTEHPVIGELPFSSDRRFMATFHGDGGSEVMVKGSPESVVASCDRWLDAETVRPLDDKARERFLAANEELARRGLRVLALAYGDAPLLPSPDGPPGRRPAAEPQTGPLVFVGLAGMLDPPAPGVEETIARFGAAGIRTLMLTGDQRLTAEAVARDLGILGPGGEAMDGAEFARLDDDALARRAGSVAVYSRIGPEDKYRIVEALRRDGDVVAMLGDGINDAAALRRADIGVAMGRRGTDVAKEAAGIVLRDDRFQTVAAAVEEGRVIFDNVRKFVFYLFSCNAAEVLVLLVAGLAGSPLPLLPLQILWLNLVTDTFPALALAFEPAEPGIMSRPPRDPDEGILSADMLRSVTLYALLITGVTLAAFFWHPAGASPHHAGAVTRAFLTLAAAQVLHVGNARSVGGILGRSGFLRNRAAVVAGLLSLALLAVAVALPGLRGILRLAVPTGRDILVIASLSTLPAIAGQMLKWFGRWSRSKADVQMV
jgi:Ca2+-transporting ATPase